MDNKNSVKIQNFNSLKKELNYQEIRFVILYFVFN